MANETQTTNPTTTKPRRWIRFRLRTLLIMVTVLSVTLGWVGWELDQRRREKAAIAWVKEKGGKVGFFSFSGRVRYVSLYVSLDSMSPIAPNDVGDLSPLAELKNLETLNLRETIVNDLSPLAELKSLKTLFLSYRQFRQRPFTKEQLEELRLALPNCKILINN